MINTKGHQKFRIIRLIPPNLSKPVNYDPYTQEGKEKIDDLNQESKPSGKMYLQAEVQLIDDIEHSITITDWNTLIQFWKKKISHMAIPNVISSQQLDLLLEQYYLKTDTPTLEYVYSLCALGASSPYDLQPLLESATHTQLIDRALKILSYSD